MLLRPDDGPELRGSGRPPFAQKALFCQTVTLERRLDALDRQALVLHCVYQRFERLALQLDIGGLAGSAYQHSVASGGNRLDCSFAGG